MDKKSGLQQRLQLIRERFLVKLPEREVKIREHWKALQEDWNQAELGPFYREIHSLAGTSATFGAEEVGDQSRLLADLLKRYPPETPPGPPQLEEIRNMLDDLSRLIGEVTS